MSDLLAEHGLRAGFFTGAEGQTPADPEHRRVPRRPGLPPPLRQRRRRRRPEPPARRQLRDQPGAALEPGRPRAADRPDLPARPEAARSTSTTSSARRGSSRGSPASSAPSRRSSRGSSTATATRSSSSSPARSCRGSRRSTNELPADLRPRAPDGDDGEPAELADLRLDDEVGDPSSTLLDAADESQDLAGPRRGRPRRGPVIPALRPPDLRRSPRRPDDRPAAPRADGDVRQLFSQLQIRREGDGRVVIEAPPEAASTLGALFEGMAALLRSMMTSPKGRIPREWERDPEGRRPRDHSPSIACAAIPQTKKEAASLQATQVLRRDPTFVTLAASGLMDAKPTRSLKIPIEPWHDTNEFIRGNIMQAKYRERLWGPNRQRQPL